MFFILFLTRLQQTAVIALRNVRWAKTKWHKSGTRPNFKTTTGQEQATRMDNVCTINCNLLFFSYIFFRSDNLNLVIICRIGPLELETGTIMYKFKKQKADVPDPFLTCDRHPVQSSQFTQLHFSPNFLQTLKVALTVYSESDLWSILFCPEILDTSDLNMESNFY